MFGEVGNKDAITALVAGWILASLLILNGFLRMKKRKSKRKEQQHSIPGLDLPPPMDIESPSALEEMVIPAIETTELGQITLPIM